MPRARWVALAVGGVVSASSGAALADEPVKYGLSWVRAEGAEDCPGARALMDEVERRLGRQLFELGAERSFEVEVTRLGGRYRSDLFVRDRDGKAVGHRSLQSDEPGCAALFGATALAIALVIDPEAASRPREAGPVASFEPPPAAPPTAKAPPPDAVAPPEPVRAPLVVPSAPAPAPPLVPTTLSARGVVGFGLVPATSPGFGLAFTARPGRAWGLALTSSYVAPQMAQRGVGIFELSLTRAALSVTFDLAASTGGVRLMLTAGPSLGILHLAAREPTPITDPGDFWALAAEAGAVLHLPVFSAVFAEAGGQLLVPLLRQSFYARRQDEAVWSQPALAGQLLFGTGLRFP